MPVWDAPDDESEDSPRQSYNFAPGYYGMVYRPDVPDRGARPGGSSDEATRRPDAENEEVSGSLEHAAPETEPEQEPEETAEADWVDVGSEADNPPAASQKPATPALASAPEPAHDASRYKLQVMRWGLVPSWTKRNPGYTSVMKTINCRSDSLSRPGGLWSTMKMRKRCIVVADGFYEWLKVGPKERIPHYIKRKDGQPMLFAGLWDCVTYEGRTLASAS